VGAICTTTTAAATTTAATNPDATTLQTKNTQAGTPAYMAPELLENASFNKSVDVYAFGILLWELFTGEVPFAGYEIPDIITQVTSGNRLRVPTVDTPVEIRRMIEDCWAQDPKARPSFPDILVVLDGLLKDMPQQVTRSLPKQSGPNSENPSGEGHVPSCSFNAPSLRPPSPRAVAERGRPASGGWWRGCA